MVEKTKQTTVWKTCACGNEFLARSATRCHECIDRDSRERRKKCPNTLNGLHSYQTEQTWSSGPKVCKYCGHKDKTKTNTNTPIEKQLSERPLDNCWIIQVQRRKRGQLFVHDITLMDIQAGDGTDKVKVFAGALIDDINKAAESK